VVLPNKDNKKRVYVNYKDLNKASPNDDFSLPYIYVLIDNATTSATY
jgi:hypothetical protein